MKTLKTTLAILLFSSATVIAAPASEGSVRQLLAVSQAQKLMDGMGGQLNALMNNAVQQALNGKAPNAKQQQAITKMKNRMVALMQGELAWEKVEPMYVRLYMESFSEEEVAGMVAFYKTPAGQAVINKMPLLMQKTMVEVQTMVSSTAPKMQKIQEDFMAEMKVASN